VGQISDLPEPFLDAWSSRYDSRVSTPLPRLRGDLDFMPSPVEDRPGLLIRDSFKYSDAVLIIPPPLVECLRCFDGRQTQLDLRQTLVKITGDLQVGEIEDQLIDILAHSGFLEDENFARMKEESHRACASLPMPVPATPTIPEHCGEQCRNGWAGEAPARRRV